MSNFFSIFLRFVFLSLLIGVLIGCGGSSEDSAPNPDPNPTPNPIDPSGIPDTTFSNSKGMAIFSNLESEGVEIILDNNGRILVAGRSLNEFSLNQFTVWRYLPDGNLDTTFGGTGYVTYNHKLGNTGSARALGIGVDSAGRIVATGEFFSIVDDNEMLLIRYNEDGSLDNSFGLNGVASYVGDQGNSLVINSDDSILITGNFFTLLKFTSDGILDLSFGNNGVVVDGTSVGNRVIKDNFDNILISGARFTTDAFITVWRYLPSGQIDTSFGINGRFSEVVGSYSSLVANIGNHLAVNSTNDIYIAAEVSNANNIDRILLKIDSDGNKLTNFGVDGAVTYDSGRHDWGRKLAISNDNIFITGSSVSLDLTSADMQVFRFEPNGTLDVGFGDSGVLTYDEYVIERGWGITTDADGKILVVGSVITDDIVNGQKINMAIWRFGDLSD